MPQSQHTEPQPGQESVWDYPRPPRLEHSTKHIEIVFNGVKIADTHNAIRILETSHPPTYYIPPQDIKTEYLTPTNRATLCEFKGRASYYTLSVNGKTETNVGWYYTQPASGYEDMAGYVAFYPGRMEACYVDGEQVQAQAGDFYGGWITHDIIGPFKGEAGTWGW